MRENCLRNVILINNQFTVACICFVQTDICLVVQQITAEHIKELIISFCFVLSAIIRCAPLDVDDAIIVSPQSCVFSHAIPGQICELRCKPGYQNNNGDTVTGVSVQVCLSDSSWNGTELNCVKGQLLVIIGYGWS